MNNSNPISEPSNWLDAKVIECDSCHKKLYWLWHSPMYHDWFFYCTDCPKWVEISLYDNAVKTMWESATENNQIDKEKLFRLIEEALAPCDCSGRYKYDATRHCLHCSAPLKQSEPGRDVTFPEAAEESIVDGASKCEEIARKLQTYARRANIWK